MNFYHSWNIEREIIVLLPIRKTWRHNRVHNYKYRPLANKSEAGQGIRKSRNRQP